MAKVLPSTWEGVPETIVARFGAKAGRQRAMVDSGHLVLVTHVVPGHDDIERTPAIFWRHPNGTWKNSGEGKGGLKVLQKVVDDYRVRAVALEADLESAKRAADYFRILQDVAPLVRAARHLQKALQEARDAIPKDGEIIALRDLAGEAERTAELVQSDARAGLDFTTAKRAEEQAESAEHIAKSSHRLNMIAALFLPMSALAGVFGVNLAHGLETTAAPYLFWAFVATAFLVGFYVRSTVSRSDPRPDA